jgi:hypothetical protein
MLRLIEVTLLDKFERFAQAHPIEIVGKHWISIGWQSVAELLDPFRSLLQFGQMSAWILLSKLVIGDHGKSIPQRLRKDNVILVHGWKVSPGRRRIQGVSLWEQYCPATPKDFAAENVAGAQFLGLGKNQSELLSGQRLQ